MMEILNLTQHPATPEQIAAGVVDLQGEALELLHSLLDFEELPERPEIQERANKLAGLAVGVGARHAMIGGAPFLMKALEWALQRANITPLYAFSRRESIEERTPDGGVRKTSVFRHLGFVIN